MLLQRRIKLLVCVVFGLLAHATGDADEESLSVSTEQGTVRGVKTSAPKGTTYYSYHGIPFAAPPVGERRYRDPEPAANWEGTLDGTKIPVPCIQNLPMVSLAGHEETFIGQEDCLVLSVHTPKPNVKDAYLPVMVYIHGGAYFFGSIEDYPPGPLMDHDVVVVQMQYRLGALGFLSTDDEVLPGNLGLKDQTLALEWVQKNIKYFGGDNLRVTIFGESAGGASVHFQILSHRALGLFHRAIIQSGTALSPWALGGKFREASHSLGRTLNCTTEDGSNSLVECLRTKDAFDIIKAGTALQVWFMLPLLFGPRVDGLYLAQHPTNLMKEARHKKLNIMIGTTKDEGGFVTLPMYASESLKQSILQDFNFYGPLLLEFSEGDLTPVHQTIKIFDKYLDDFKIDEESADNITQLLTDRHMAISHDVTAMWHAKNVNPKKRVYKYELHKRPLVTLNDAFGIPFGKKWVSHIDDLCYLFEGSSMFPKIEDEENLKFRDIVTTLWYNFANTGNPTPDDSLGFTWTPATSEDLSLLILKDQPEMKEDPRKEIREFWLSLPTKQNMVLYPEKVKKLDDMPINRKYFKTETKIENNDKIVKFIQKEKGGEEKLTQEKSDSSSKKKTDSKSSEKIKQKKKSKDTNEKLDMKKDNPQKDEL